MTRGALLAALAVASVGAAVWGLAVDAGGFASDLLAEAVGLVAGVIVAVFIADYLIEGRRRDQWGKVASTTIGAIADRLGGVAHAVIELGLCHAPTNRGLF